MLLLRHARRTIDVQYYIWHDDLSGSLMLDELAAAADRGIRVRLLLDDNGIAGLDARLAALADQPNIEIRLFNPFTIRRPKAVNWLFAFRRLNHRMHAKSLTIDGEVTIVGGRNIGDAYFGARPKGLFEDLDVLVMGQAVQDALAVFNRHWHSRAAHPAQRILAGVSARARQRATNRAALRTHSAAAEHYRAAIRASPLFDDLRNGDLSLIWAPVRVVASGPLQVPEPGARRTGLAQLLPRGLLPAQSDAAETASVRELIVISGYFVPTEQGCHDLAGLARDGTRIRVLTNSFAATDVGLVHAGYAPCRQTLLRNGIELFEMPAPDDKPKATRKFIRPGSTKAREQSGRSLHAKIYIADRQRVYVGSANFDPRSAHLNTELGFVIESPALADAMSDSFETATGRSYRLSLGNGKGLRWTDERDDLPEPEVPEPGTNPFTRTLIRLLSRLPIASQL